MTTGRRQMTNLGAFLIGFPGLLGGLLALEGDPVAGTLIALAAMALLLYAAAGFCKAPGIYEPILQRTHKEDGYGGERPR
ncbi:MAG: hypothetical protein LAN37_01745 [Acidobacteriia bacterium]|nr:hypothetical protein [Terriglobia bacterium]